MNAPVNGAAAQRCADWPALAGAVRGCIACPELAATRRTVVAGTAPAGAALLLIGEAPGAAEDASGVPFVGRSGALLDRLLAEVGLDRAAVAVANVVKCRPPGNRRPTPAEVQRCRPWLARQLELVEPVLTVLLGGTALSWVFGRPAQVGRMRGRPHVVDGRRYLASYHPSAAIRFGLNGAPLASLRSDLALAAQLLTAPSC
jgi:uracil-DNA glycosylase